MKGETVAKNKYYLRPGIIAAFTVDVCLEVIETFRMHAVLVAFLATTSREGVR